MPISPDIATRLSTLVSDLDSAAARAESAATGASSGWFNSAWQSFVGDQSTVSAAASLAHSQRSLANSVRDRVARLDSDADALQLLQEAKASHWADVGDLEALASSLTFGGGVSDIASASARDALDDLSAVGGAALSAAKWLPFVALGVVAFFLWSKLRRVAR